MCPVILSHSLVSMPVAASTGFHSPTTYSTKTEITKLMKNEFKLNYNNHIISGLMNIWGTKVNNKLVIEKSTFPKLFKKPEGFFRDIHL